MKNRLVHLIVLGVAALLISAQAKTSGTAPSSSSLQLFGEVPSYHFESDRRTTFVAYEARVGDHWVTESTYGINLTKLEKQLVSEETQTTLLMMMFKPRVPISGRILFVEMTERKSVRMPTRILEMAVTAEKVVLAWDGEGAPKRWIALRTFQQLLAKWDRG